MPFLTKQPLTLEINLNHPLISNFGVTTPMGLLLLEADSLAQKDGKSPYFMASEYPFSEKKFIALVK